MVQLRVIDLSSFCGGGAADRRRVAGETDAARCEIGFFAAVGHGVDADLAGGTLEGDQCRASPHTGYGTWTILKKRPKEKETGLQAQPARVEWIDVIAPEGTVAGGRR